MSTLFENIERIQLGKEKLKTSIENKDVVVPDDMLIDEYYSLVDQIQTGIGEDFTITDCSYMFNENARLELFDILFPHLSNQPTNITNMFKGTQINPMNFEYIDRYLAIADFSKCKYAKNWCYYSIINDEENKTINLNFPEVINGEYLCSGIKIKNPITIYINLNAHKLTNCSHAFQYLGHNSNLVNFTFELDLKNSTSNSTDFYNIFSNCKYGNLKIKNLNMDKATSTSNMFNYADALKQLTFSGSFGSSSTTSSLTIDLTKCVNFTVEAFLETMTTIYANTSEKTRIFKLPSALYNALTDDIWDLADEKLYDIASA